MKSFTSLTIFSNGSETKETDLIMAEYLLPTNSALTICEKQKMFGIKNRMVNISANFPKPNIEYKCFCGQKEDMKHVYNCELLNEGRQPNIEYERIFTGNISEQIEVFRIFEQNMERRETMKENKIEQQPPCDPNVIHCPQQSIVMD